MWHLNLYARIAGAVVLSDTDMVWLRHVGPLLAAHPAADVFVSTDCASHEVEHTPSIIVIIWDCTAA